MFEIGDTTNVTELFGAMLIGLTKDNEFVNVTDRKLDVAFLNCQKHPPCVVTVAPGAVILLNDEFVM